MEKNVSLQPLEHQGNKYQQKIQKNLSTHHKSFNESQKAGSPPNSCQDTAPYCCSAQLQISQSPPTLLTAAWSAPGKACEFLKPSAISGQRHGVGCAHFLPHQLDAIV